MCLTAMLLLASASVVTGQQTEEPLSFASDAAAITVDVVVLDEDGRPVRDLTRDDFTIIEDGDAQAIVGFEARDLTLASEPVEGISPGATNVAAAEPGRVLALLIDDLGVTAPTLAQLRPALVGWLHSSALPRDEVTLMTTSGDVWWSDVVARGRDDLIASLERVSAKRLDESATAGWISDWEAYQIAFQGFSLELLTSPAQRSRPDSIPGGLGSTLERVVRRYLDAGLCSPLNLSACYAQVQGAALQVQERWRLRAETAYGAIGRLSRSLAGIPGRKSILLVAEEFINDRSIDGPFRGAIDATQRANTAVYFLAARGLTASSIYSAANRHAPQAHETARINLEEGVLALGGAEALAETTGGVLTRSNDLAEGLDRMARESSAYYLLGYQPEKAPDGKWHDLEVRVAREGVRVRARRTYLASRPEDVARADDDVLEGLGRGREGQDDEGPAPKRAVAPAMLTGSVRGKLPVRLSTYLGEPAGDAARVQVVVEVDNSKVRVNRAVTPWRALLDVTVMAASVERAPIVPVDERMDLSLGPGEVGTGWWMLARDATLPPGTWQIRALVRDLGSGTSGLVTQRISVPDVDQPYLSSLVITDRTLPPPRFGEPRRLVPAADPRFGRRGDVICQYEVFGFGGRDLDGVPQLLGGYTLQRAGDDEVKVVSPTAIRKAGQRAVRRIVLPLRDLQDGRYAIVVTVQDKLAQRTLVTRGSFVVERASEGD